MKRFLATMVAFALVITFAVPAFAASGEGTAGDPITTIPRSSIDKSSGAVKGAEVTAQELKVTVKDLETQQVNGDWVITNPLSAPTKNTIKCEISSATSSKVEINGTQVLAGGTTEAKDFTFNAGETYTIIVIDNTTLTKKFYWEFRVPAAEKDAPVVTLSSNGTTIQANGTKFSDTVQNYDRKNLRIESTDATGIDNVMIALFPNNSFSGTPLRVWGKAVSTSDKKDKSAEYSGMQFTYETIPAQNNDGNVFDSSTGNLTQMRDTLNCTEDSFILYQVSDVFGNTATYTMEITGINPQNDNSAPVVKLQNVNKTESNGTVTEITGKVVVSDAPGNVSSVKIMQGSKELVNQTGIDKQSVEFDVSVKSGDSDKVLVVTASDRAGLVTTENLDFSGYFNGSSGNQGGNDSQGDSTNKAPTITLGEVTKDTTDGVVTKIQAIIQLSDADSGLKSAKIVASDVTVINEDITGTNAKSYIISMGSSVSSKKIVATATDAAGKTTTETFDMSSYFTTGDSSQNQGGTNTGTISSVGDLKKAISDPSFTYDDDYTTVEFTIDTKKVGNQKVTWELLDLDGDEMDDDTGTSYSYEFDADDDDEGRYKVRVTVGNYKTTIGFDLEYRDSSDIASALKVTKDYLSNGKCEIELKLNGDMLDGARKARWTLPNGDTDTGKSVTYTVSENGKYSFRIRTDDDSYTHTVTIDDIGAPGSSSGNSGNSGNSGSQDVSGGSTSSGNGSSSGNKYTGNSNPKPGSGLVSNITSATQKVTIPMNNWDKNEWTLDRNSIPAGISVEENGSDLVFTAPNQNTRVSFRMVNSRGEYVEYNFDIAKRATDGSTMAGNAQTGGQLPTTSTASSGVSANLMALPCELSNKYNKGTKERLNDDDIE